MSTNHTPNYNLSQWEKSDKVLMEDFNADNAKIDGALKAQADGLAAEASARSALAALTAKKGNCKIETRSYTGTGQSGDGAYVSISFSAKPVAFFVIGPRSLFIVNAVTGSNAFLGYVYNPGYSSTFNGSSTSITWSGNTAQIAIPAAIRDMNLSNTTYSAIAFLAADQ